MDLPVGKGLGGSSNINACLCAPPLEKDFAQWGEPWKSSLYSKAKHIENILRNNGVLHDHAFNHRDHSSFSNMKNVSWNPHVSTMVKKDEATGKWIRCNYYDGLLRPLFEKFPHLMDTICWFRGYECQRLLINIGTTRIIGVECCKDDDHMIEIHAKRRTILCTGAIETPAILLVSNLGLPGVGNNLQDQALLARLYFTLPAWVSRTTTVGDSHGQRNEQSTNGIAALGHYPHHHGQTGSVLQHSMYQMAIADSVANASILPSVLGNAFRWNVQHCVGSYLIESMFQVIKSCIQCLILYTPVGFILDQFTTTMILFMMHPKSSGTVTIYPKKNAKDTSVFRRCDVAVRIDPGYLTDQRDQVSLKKAWENTSAPSFEIFPGFLSSILSFFSVTEGGFWFRLYCRCFLQPYYHFSGTCRMSSTKQDEDEKGSWVVQGSNLKVKDHDGLYICDASVFPSMVSNPPALTLCALGYEFAQIVLTEDMDIEKRTAR